MTPPNEFVKKKPSLCTLAGIAIAELCSSPFAHPSRWSSSAVNTTVRSSFSRREALASVREMALELNAGIDEALEKEGAKS